MPAAASLACGQVPPANTHRSLPLWPAATSSQILLIPVATDDPLGSAQLRHGAEDVLEELHVALLGSGLPSIVAIQSDHL